MANETLNVNVNLTNNRTGHVADAKNIKGGFVPIYVEDMTQTIPETVLPSECIVEGQLVYNTYNSKFYQCDDMGVWNEVVIGGGGSSDLTDHDLISRVNTTPTATATSPDFVETPNGGLYRKVVSSDGLVPPSFTYSYKFILPTTTGQNNKVLKVTADGSNVVWSTDSGMTNPMTTAGDLIVGGTDGTPERMAIGNDGKVLGVESGSLAWVSLPEPMVFRGGVEITIDNQNVYEIVTTDTNIRVGYTYKITTAPSGDAHFKVGDTLIAAKNNPETEEAYATLIADWTLIPSGDEPSGTVTSVGLTVPTGLSVIGSPVTSSGTLAVSLASGYVIPTQTTLDGKQPVINNNNKLSADYVDDTSTTNKFVTATDITTWNGKQNAIDSSNKLSASYIATDTNNQFVSASDITAWNGKLDSGDLKTINNTSIVGSGNISIQSVPVPQTTDAGKVISVDSSGDYQLSNATITVDNIPTNQANIAFILSNNTNINGKAMSAYSWNYYQVTSQSTTYETYQIKKNNAILTKAEASDYLAGLCGTHFVAEYNYDIPTNSYIIRASDYQILKPQWDSTNGLLLWFMNKLVKEDVNVRQSLYTSQNDGTLPILTSQAATSNANTNYDGTAYRWNGVYVQIADADSTPTISLNAPVLKENGTSLESKYLRYYSQNDATSGVTVANINAPVSSAGDKVLMGLSNNDGAQWGKVGAAQMSGSLPYTTTAPTANNTDGIKIVVLSSEPATYYDGYYYIITGA